MKKMDDLGLILCQYQADMFEATHDYLNCSSRYFMKKFANSKLAERMDKKGFIWESLDILAALDELKKSTDLSIGKVKYSKPVLHWIGYLYRYWSYTYEISTKTLFDIIKIDELAKLYEAYHSLDIEAAIERLAESKDMADYGSLAWQIRMVKKKVQNK